MAGFDRELSRPQRRRPLRRQADRFFVALDHSTFDQRRDHVAVEQRGQVGC
jgi:hypothetical protein